MFLKSMRALKITKNSAEYIDDPVAVEGRVTIYVNDEQIASQVASLSDLKELGAGYVISEGISNEIISAEAEETDVYVYANNPSFADREICSAGGYGFVKNPKRVLSDIRIKSEDVARATDEIISDVWEKTGGVHCSVLFRNKKVISRMSDVGRHNTLDKIIGYAALNRINCSECYVGCTGRQPSGMVKKCANAGIPLIISKAASTASGIQTAEESGITLICFARGERYTVYSHPERITGIINP
ncbi:MAG: formate dehydrogenase accessory sulfurtransferase FdhD [Methanomicrobiaceae archaeon]|nr:formate dehydrogenase accessory sulfurtransferase FdhD [Methanomicrobiaceae archaeon]